MTIFQGSTLYDKLTNILSNRRWFSMLKKDRKKKKYEGNLLLVLLTKCIRIIMGTEHDIWDQVADFNCTYFVRKVGIEIF